MVQHTDPHAPHSPQCQALLEQLGDYIDGELEASLCAQLEAHLSSCRDCRVLVDTTRKTVLLYRQHRRESEIPLPPDITTRLWQALRDNGCVE